MHQDICVRNPDGSCHYLPGIFSFATSDIAAPVASMQSQITAASILRLLTQTLLRFDRFHLTFKKFLIAY